MSESEIDFSVEKILGLKFEKGELLFYVKWLNVRLSKVPILAK